MDWFERILKNEIRLLYFLHDLLGWPVYSTKCYINKQIFKNNCNTIRKLRNMKESLIQSNVSYRNNVIHLKRIPYLESNNNEVALFIDISGNCDEPVFLLICKFKKRNVDTMDEIAKNVNGMKDEEFYNSITVIKLNKSKHNITQIISSYDSTESESFYIYHIIEGNPLENSTVIGNMIVSENLIVSEPFSPYSQRRLYRNNPAKVDEYYYLHLSGESGIVNYYINPIFKERINNEDELQINNEMKFDINFYHFGSQFSLQNFNSNFSPINNYSLNSITENNIDNLEEQQSIINNNLNSYQSINFSMPPENLLSYRNQIDNNVMNDAINYFASLLSSYNNVNDNNNNDINSNFTNQPLSLNNNISNGYSNNLYFNSFPLLSNFNNFQLNEIHYLYQIILILKQNLQQYLSRIDNFQNPYFIYNYLSYLQQYTKSILSIL